MSPGQLCSLSLGFFPYKSQDGDSAKSLRVLVIIKWDKCSLNSNGEEDVPDENSPCELPTSHSTLFTLHTMYSI